MIFDLCVLVLVVLAEWLGITYEAINVWFFVVIWPIFTLVLIAIVIWQRLKIRKLSGRVDRLDGDIGQ
jgi:hypothetical protein